MMLVANIFKTALRNAAASKSVFNQLSAYQLPARQKKHNNELNQTLKFSK